MKALKKMTAIFLIMLLVLCMIPASEILADGESTGNFIVTGGVYGVDYEYVTGTTPFSAQAYGENESYNTTQYTPKSGGVVGCQVDVLKIKTSTPLTISTNGTSTAGILIEKGVHADLTFNNVNITAPVPVNLLTNTKEVNSYGRPILKDEDGNGIWDYLEAPTSMHLTLADGSNNVLNAWGSNHWGHSPGIHCGEGSKLTIDDGRKNVDINGEFVAPEQGRISRDATLQDGTTVKKGDRLTLLDSDNPGTLTVYGGYRAAAIGGGGLESSGDITVNGGNIIVRPYGENEGEGGAGSGIGGGHAGCGTVMTFNGGNIDSIAAYHSAGIGGGCTYGGGMSNGGQLTYAFTDAYLSEFPLHTVAGDIYINGGYIRSQGRTHGNAFGQACGGTNNGHSIIITGGTLLPSSYSGWYDIGGAGGDVIVTGGSIRLSADGKFQSDGNIAWGDLEKTVKVFMTKINLQGYNKPNLLVDGMKMTINGLPTDYGMPSYTDETGNLYLWLPNSTDGTKPEVRVELDMKDKDTGEDVKTDPFFVTDAGYGSVLKQYVYFTIDENKITDENRLTKRYDGLSFSDAQKNSFLTAVVETGIPVSNPEGKSLDDISAMEIQSQRLNEALEVDETEAITEGFNANVGKYQLTITTKQYSNTAGFSESFWGHRCYYKYAEIIPADSKTVVTLVTEEAGQGTTARAMMRRRAAETRENMITANTPIILKAYVSSDDDEAVTCAAPTGQVQFYVNGKAYGNPVTLETGKDAEEANAAGHAQSVASITWTPTQNSGVYAVEGTQSITAKYLGQEKGNYNLSESDAAEIEIDPVEQGEEEIGGTPIEITDDTTGTVIPSDKSEIEKIYGEDFKLTLGGGDTEETPVFVSSNPEVAVVDEDGTVHIVGVGEAVITATRPGNGAYHDKSQVITVSAGKRPLTVDCLNILNRYYNGKVDAAVDPSSVALGGLVEEDRAAIAENLAVTAAFPAADVGTYPDASATLTLSEAWAEKYCFVLPDGNSADTISVTDEAKILKKPISSDPENKPEVNIDTDGDGKPDINVDTDDDGDPDINIDIDGDGEPDVNIDTDGDGKPDINIEPTSQENSIQVEHLPYYSWTGKPITPSDLQVKDGDQILQEGADYTVRYENNVEVGTATVIIVGKGNYADILTSYFRILKINIDTDGDGKPDVNIDTDDDGKPDVNIDTNDDGKPDVNIDTNGDGKPDVNIDTNDDGKPDLNIDTNGDGKADLNIDTNGDGKADLNVDINDDGKPELNIDTDGDGKPDQNIDADGDSKIDQVGPATGDWEMTTYAVMLMAAVLGLAMLAVAKKRMIHR